LVFLIAQRPPRPTLSPYTTLFRSGAASDAGADDAVGGTGGRAPAHAVVNTRSPSSEPRTRIPKRSNPKGAVRTSSSSALVWYPRDRKSTRLNSSHQIISYAVFCLK